MSAGRVPRLQWGDGVSLRPHGRCPQLWPLGFSVAGTPDLDKDGRGESRDAGALADISFGPGSSPGRRARFLFAAIAQPSLWHIWPGARRSSRPQWGRRRRRSSVGAEAESVGQHKDVGRAYLFNGAKGKLVDTLGYPHKATGGNFGLACPEFPTLMATGSMIFSSELHLRI